MNALEIYKQFRQRMQQHGDQELTGLFNKEVGKPGWGTARACYLAAIHAEWTARGFDFSLVGDSQGLSFRHKVRLVDGVIRCHLFPQTDATRRCHLFATRGRWNTIPACHMNLLACAVVLRYW